MDVGHLLNRELQVWRPVTAPDGAGGYTTTLVQQPGTVWAKVDQPSDSEQMVAAQARSEHDHDIYLLPDADVRRGDELRDPDTGEKWRVLAVVRPSAPIYRKAHGALIQTEGGTP
ncbi:phage head closure protein [Streptomyces sp. URMC 129]|uniref:phage head closure protein n=1 Tax=Streptomyces sp. URMC 129 TaxID=3423407 RepID=UPI003F199D2A